MNSLDELLEISNEGSFTLITENREWLDLFQHINSPITRQATDALLESSDDELNYAYKA